MLQLQRGRLIIKSVGNNPQASQTRHVSQIPLLQQLERKTSCFVTLVLIVVSFYSLNTEACPGSLFSHELSPALTGNRSGLQLFVLEEGKKASWHRIGLQIDPVDEDGRLEFFDNEGWLKKDLGTYDRIVFRSEEFGRKKKKKEKLPCQGAVFYELADVVERGKYAYLTNCPIETDFSKLPAKKSSLYPVAYSKKEGSLVSDTYSYTVSEKNHMLFNRVKIQNLKDKKSLLEVAKNSDILIRADLKNFLNFNFDADDIESYLEEMRVGELGVNAKLSFYLRVFYVFSIKLKLSSDVSFYRDSANIPMVIHLPIEPKKHLNPASGIIYSWITNTENLDFNLGKNISIMNDQKVELIKSGWKNLSKFSRHTCRGSSVCRYRFGMDGGGSGFVMDFKIRKSMVKRGFFPLFVEDASVYNKKMNWKLDLPEPKAEGSKADSSKRVGFYFETSGLEKGSYPWDFWMRLGESKKLKHYCPRPVYVRSTITKV